MEVGALGSNIHLVVEELDRLSRQPADVMLAWLSPLIRSGITIHVTQTRQIINVAMLDHDMGGLMMLLVTAFGSYTESRKKAHRVAAAWEQKRAKAAAGEAVTLTHRSPAWIEVQDGEFVVRPERRTVIEYIFRRRLEGVGKLTIAKELNAQGTAVWSNTSRAASMWTATYVGRILNNRAVTGEWQPYTRTRSATERKVAGDPIENYYPALISTADFARANDKRAEQQRKHIGRGRSVTNLFGPLARCKLCNGQMTALGSASYKINKNGDRRRYYFLYCENAKVAKTCSNQEGWTYDRVQQPLLDSILSRAMDDQYFGSDTRGNAIAERAVYEARAGVDSALRKLQRWTAIINGDDEEAAEAAMAMWTRANRTKLESEKALAEAEDEFERVKGKVSPAEHIKRVSEVRFMMDSDDHEQRYAARMSVKNALGDLIDKMTFDPATKRVWVDLRDGVMTLLIDYQSGEVTSCNFVHPGRSWHTDDPTVAAYLRRNGHHDIQPAAK